MMHSHKTALFFALLLLVFFSAMTGTVYAQTATPTPPCPTDGSASTLDTQLTTDFAVPGQQKIQAKNAAQALFASLDVKAQACWNNIQKVFSAIGAHGDPLQVIANVIAQEALNLVNQACSIALGDVKQLASFAQSQLNRLCLPLPNFGLGGASLGLHNVTCNGTALLQPGPSTTGKDPINFDIRNLFPQAAKPTSSQ